MRTSMFLGSVCIVLLMMGCGPKKGTGSLSPDQQPTVQTTVDSVTPVQNVEDWSKCDMVMLDNGKLFFYNSHTANMFPFEAETDSIVNSVFAQDGKLYYCVADDSRILLRCVDLSQSEPLPQQLADWGVPYDSCVTETYGTVSPLLYYAGRNMLGLWHEFSWESYSLTQQKLYDLGTGVITDWDWETWEDEEQTGDDDVENMEDEVLGYLTTREGNYYFQDGLAETCLTDKIDLNKYVSDPDYASEPEFEYVASSPDHLKILFMAILEWGDLPHGILCISSTDGNMQLPLEDTDCTGYIAQWLDDGSLVYVGEKPLSPDADDQDVSWHYTDHCIKRVYPDGHIEIISDCGDFQVRK